MAVSSDPHDALQQILAERNQLIQRMETAWDIQAGLPPMRLPLIDRLRRWLANFFTYHLARAFMQQRDFNVGVVNTSHRFAAAFDAHLSQSQLQHDALHALVQLHQKQAAAHLDSLNQQMLELQALMHTTQKEFQALREAQLPLWQHMIDIEHHLLDIDNAQTVITQQIAGISATIDDKS